MADQAGEVVIVGPDGTEHVFPPNFDPKRAAAIVRGGSGASPAVPTRTWTDTGIDALPMIGGAIGGLAGAVPGAILGGAAGKGFKDVANYLREKPAPTTVGQSLQEMGTEGATQGALEGAGRLVSAAVTPIAQSVYRGYLKPSLSRVNVGKAQQIVETAFSENLPVTEGAYTEARQRIGELKSRVDQILAASPGQVDLHEVADRVRSWAYSMFNRPGRAPEDLKAALDVADRIERAPTAPPSLTAKPVDLTTANAVKRDLQEGVGTSQYGIPSRAGKTAEKYGARETRLAIEAQAPDVGPLNMRESRLIDLARSLQRATARESNRNTLFGVPTLLSGAVGAEDYRRTGDPYGATARALALRLSLTPAVATRAALLASRIAERAPGAVPDVARAAVQAVLESEQGSQQGQQ